MRHATAITLTVLLACLALAGAGNAQTVQPVQIQGTIQSADCQTGQVTLATASGTETFQATGQTAAYVNGGAVSLCSLQSYTGDTATATLIPTGVGFDLTQINVTAQTAPSGSGSLLSSPVAVGVGALLLGGLIGYLIGHHSDPQPQVYYGSGAPVYYYPANAAPAWLPHQYPYNRAYNYQGHRYYRCQGGTWTVDRFCDMPERR
jgi:hypothetical protein